MLSETYLYALKNFTLEEVKLIKQYHGETKANKRAEHYSKMYSYVLSNAKDFIPLEDSNVNYIEMEFAERVEKIKEKLIALASENNIPDEIIFLPRVKIIEQNK